MTPPRPGAADLLTMAGGAPVETIADVGGGGLELVLAALAEGDLMVTLIDLDRKGGFPAAPSDWIAPYRAALAAAGLDEASVRVVRNGADIGPQDLILNLGGFGDRYKIKHLQPVLDRAFHADSRMISDVRKGSGSFPFLKGFGSCEILWQSADEDETCVLFRPTAPAKGGAAGDDWAVLARDLAGPGGFFREGGEHSFLFIPRGPTLVVTFDNLDIAMGKREDRRPWGFAFIEKQGFSMLGVMAGGWTWYRDNWVVTEFDRLRDEGFFGRFGRVVFYGASMGGYAALAFAAACPGAEVVAISPQSTLDRTLVPWETRYKTAWDRDFSGPYGDAARAVAGAGRATIIYDPHEPLDRGHAERFTSANVTLLRAPLLGHRLGSSLLQMGILSDVVLAALAGRLEPLQFYRALRGRHRFARYQRELFQRALDRGRPGLARKVGVWVLKHGDNRAIRQAMAGLGGAGPAGG